MKTPLIYQMTNYDCGPTSFVNAFRFLYEREEILPELVKRIYTYCLDGYGKDGAIGKSGTSAEIFEYLSFWFNHFAESHGMKLKTKAIMREAAMLSEDSEIIKAVKEGGASVIRIELVKGAGHYVLLTGYQDGDVYLFDPFIMDTSGFDPCVRVVEDKPYEYNRIVPLEFMAGAEILPYKFGPAHKHEAMVFYPVK